MTISLACLIALVIVLASVWAILHFNNSVLTIVAIGTAIVGCIWGVSLAPLPLQFLIAIAAISLNRVQIRTRG